MDRPNTRQQRSEGARLLFLLAAGFIALCIVGPCRSHAADFALTPTETAMVEQLNAFRARQGRPALKPAGWLMERARSHTRWMLQNGMIHSQGIAENIAMGQGSVTSVTNTWINSSGHRANMLGNHSYVGVAGYTSANGTPYWTQQFSGSPTGSPVAIEGGGGPVKSVIGRFRFFRRR